MSTFVSTTLTRRTGATTTAFEPAGVAKGYHFLRASGASALSGPFVRVSQDINDAYRRSTMRIVVPQLDSNGMVFARPAADVALYIPFGSANDDVNDLVGYLNALTATSLTNFDSFLVDGVGMY